MTTIGVLGTLHDEKMREEYNYSLDRMKTIIEDFHPDIICGEIRPEDWQLHLKDSKYSGYLGPNEYRSIIIDYCSSNDVEFCPVDWFEEDLVHLDYSEKKTDEETGVFESKFNAIIEEYIRVGSASKIPFNSVEYNEIVRRKQNLQLDLNPEVHNIYWIARNQIMVRRIMKVIIDNPDKRILCTVGAEHCYVYCDWLSKYEYVSLFFPLE